MQEYWEIPGGDIEPNIRPIGRFFIANDHTNTPVDPWETFKMTEEWIDRQRHILKRPLSLVTKLAVTDTNHVVAPQGVSVKDTGTKPERFIWLALDQSDTEKQWFGWHIAYSHHHVVMRTSSMATRYARHYVLNPKGVTKQFDIAPHEQFALHHLVVRALHHPHTLSYIDLLKKRLVSPQIQAEMQRLRSLQTQRGLFAHEVQYYMSLQEGSSFPAPPWRSKDF